MDTQEIERLLKAATPGPWYADDWIVRTIAQNYSWQIADAGFAPRSVNDCNRNAALIAAAPDLAAEVLRLRADNAQLIAANQALVAREAEARAVIADAVDAWDTHNNTGDHMAGYWAYDARAFLAGKAGA